MLKKASVVFMALALCSLFGVGAVSAQPLPWGQEVTNVDVTRGGLGDVLLYDLFDVRPEDNLRSVNWQNYFVIENTSGAWTAVHLRFRSWKKSIEVWDHVILLSPRDVFWAVIQRATEAGTTSDGEDYAVGEVIIWSGDTHTLLNSGLIYPPDTDWVDIFRTDLIVESGFADEQSAIQAGYVEVIGLWELTIPTQYFSGWEDNHDIRALVRDLYNLDPDNADWINIYDIMEAIWARWTSATNAWQTWPAQMMIGDGGFETGFDGETRWAVDCSNSLAGSLERGDLDTGRYEMGNFVALRDFRTTTAAEAHRDGSPLGAIGFPAQIFQRVTVPFAASQPKPYNTWNDIGGFYYNGGVYMPRNISVRLGNAYYVNESYSSNIGPGLRDGDDTWKNNAGCVGVAGPVAPFNDIWSLDDVEVVLQSGNLWNHYYNAHNGVDYWSDLVLTFPTKHYHWLFANWPWWNDGGIANRCPINPAPLYDDDTLDWEVYLNRVVAFRAGVQGGLANYDNGPVYAFRRVWNMEQDLPEPGPPQGSPRPPEFDEPIPHEVNILAVGDDTTRPGYGIGIHDADPVLKTAYGDGQFTIGPFWLTQGGRDVGFTAGSPHPIYRYFIPAQPAQYLLPTIEEIIFTHAYSGFATAIRSTCTPVKFDFVYELDGLFPYWPQGFPIP